MKIEEKLKARYLYSSNQNLFKFLYFLFQFLKLKFRPRIINANWGLDVVVKDILKNKKKGIYVDVGCHHPLINNNTYLLYKKGWRGINIDINQTSIDLFNIIRPKDTNLCTTINETKETFKVYFDDPFSPVNTLDKQFYENLENKHNNNEKKLTVESKSMKEILNISKIDGSIDFINLDVEGMDYKILKNIDLKQLKPKLISIETHDVDGSKSKDFESIVKLMKSSSFSIYKRVGPTTLFSFSG